MSPNDINEVSIVGVSTRIPKIKQLLSDLFTINKLKFKINADEAIAYGAAFEAAMITKKSEMKNYSDFEIIDVNPHSLGISSRGGTMSIIIKKKYSYSM
jgi:L1 cell adhesion molecule like protein